MKQPITLEADLTSGSTHLKWCTCDRCIHKRYADSIETRRVLLASNADRVAGPCSCEYCLSNMPVVDAPRTWSDIEPLVSQLTGVKHLALEADLTSGTLRFNDPEQLKALVMIARAITDKPLHTRKLLDLYRSDLSLLQSIADIVLPSDSV